MNASRKEVELTKESNEDTKRSLSFDFEEQEQKLVIKAQSKSKMYACTEDPHPKHPFERIKKNLSSYNFDLIAMNDEVLKLYVGGVHYLELKSQEEQVINQLRGDIQELKDELDCQKTRSKELEAVIKGQDKQIKELLTKLEQMEASKISSLMTRFSQLDERLNQLEQFNSSSQKTLEVLENVTLLKNNCFRLSEWKTKSKVVKTDDEVNNINSFFDKKNIEYVQLLYRASENGFSAYEFHGKCDHIPGTLVVCQNEFERKIGGYNALAWSSSGATKPDQTEGVQSFIFSLTNNHKFSLMNSENAIYDLASHGPIFGTDDLMIVHNANVSPCKANINVRYNNSKYTVNNVGSWKSFTGNPGNDKASEFKLREWEVWRVIFKSGDKENEWGFKKMKFDK